MGTDADLHGEFQAEFDRLRHAMPEIRGCLVAGVDGLLIAENAGAVLAEGMAALTAASLGVSQRIADVAGHDEFEEVLIRSSGGYVAMYLAGNGALLVILASADTNVGRLHHEARRSRATIARIVGVARATFAQTLPHRAPRPVPEPTPW